MVELGQRERCRIIKRARFGWTVAKENCVLSADAAAVPATGFNGSLKADKGIVSTN